MGPDLHSRLAAELCAAIPHGRRAAGGADSGAAAARQLGRGAHDHQGRAVSNELYGGRESDADAGAQDGSAAR